MQKPVLSDASFSASQDGFKGDDGFIITLEGDFVNGFCKVGVPIIGQMGKDRLTGGLKSRQQGHKIGLRRLREGSTQNGPHS